MNRERTLTMLVFAAAAALYLLSIRNGFAYDDNAVIRADERIHSLSRVGELLSQPYWTDPELGLYRPLTSLSFALDWTLSGGNASWFHFVNVLWNAIAAALVVVFLSSFVSVPLAALGGLLFAVHPVHVEAVANVVGRAELMAGVFSLAALVLWVRSDESRLPPRRLAGVTSLYALALMSKESAIMLPAVLALADSARGVLTPATLRGWVARHASALVAMAVTALAFLLIRATVLGGLGPARVDPTLDVAIAPLERILTALQAWPVILRLLILPYTLLADYGPRIIMPATTITPAAAAGALIFSAFVVGGVAAWLRGEGRTAAVLLMLPVTLLPTSNLIVPIGVIVAERTLYLPSLAVIMLVVFALDSPWRGVRRRRTIVAAALAVAALFAVRTLVRIPEWQSTTTVHAALRRDRPDSFRAEWHHARTAVNSGMPTLALERYARAVDLWPHRHGLVLEAAAYAAQVGATGLARQLTALGVNRWPDDVAFLRMQAGLYLDAGDFAAARPIIDRGLRLAPADPTLLEMRKAAAGGPR